MYKRVQLALQHTARVHHSTALGCPFHFTIVGVVVVFVSRVGVDGGRNERGESVALGGETCWLQCSEAHDELAVQSSNLNVV
jgi:hypothetical protein